MAVAGLQDFIGTGTMTHFWAGQLVQDTATVRGLGMSDFRLDDDRSDGTHSWSVSEAGGQHRTPDGTTSPMPWGDAVNLLSVTWPLPILVEAVNNPIWQVSLIGQANFNGRAAFDIRVEQIFSTAADPGGKFSALTTRDVFIDSGNYVVLGIQDLTHRNDVFHRTYVRQILYSDYRPVSGLSVPFSVTETISGQKVWTFTLSSISFNNNLTAADFAL